MKILKVPEKYNNKKLITFLTQEFSGLSTSTIYKTLRKKDIKINDSRISDNCLLKTGDELKIYIPDDLLYPKLDIPIVYEDENIIVFDKPIGIEVTGNNSVETYVKNNINPNYEPCHRLDRNTSGLVLFAKNDESLQIILDLFKHHSIDKHYMALVYGIPKEKSKRLIAYLFKDSKKSIVYISEKKQPKYQEIITNYKVVKTNVDKNIALLDVNIETGRTHQIRAHLAHIGLPIVGDGKYGINQVNQKFGQKTQLLSSYSLTFHLNGSTLLSYLDNKTIINEHIPFINLI